MPAIIKTLIAVAMAAAICFVFYNFCLAPTETRISRQAQILFAGDLMFDRNIRYYAQLYGNEYVFEKIHNFLLSNDLVVANLEGPITNEKSVSWGTGPGDPTNCIFTFSTSLADTLFKENIRLVSLANNHILNFGNRGLEATKQYLGQAGVEYLDIIKEVNGIKIAFVAYNEFDPSTSLRTSPVDEIKKANASADVVIVFSHWGQEYVKEPNQVIKDLAHSFIDAGADLIIGSHPHVVQITEEYKGKRIYYSLGNFVFDQYFSEDVKRGLGVVVKIDEKTKQLQFEEIEFYFEPNGQTTLVDKTNEK